MVDAAALVLAMPRRELFRVTGFSPSVDLAVLESLAEESWYSAPQALADNHDAKEVRLGLLAVRRREALVSCEGVLLHATPIPPETGRMGPGLSALRELALGAGRQLVGTDRCRVELAGYCNDDAMPECRPYFILVYRLRVAADNPAPPGMEWIGIDRLPGIPLDPVSALVTVALQE